MPPEKLISLVDDAVNLHRSIADLKDRLDCIKQILVKEAARRREDGLGARTDGGGVSLTLDGQDCVARVVFPGPSLISGVKKTDREFPKIEAAAGKFFKSLFRPVTTCKPVADFRSIAVNLLGEKDAAPLIKLCETESIETVSFEVTEKFGDDFP